MTEGLPRPVSTEDALAYAGRLDDLCNAEWVLKRLTDGANALRTLVSERDALAVRVSELEREPKSLNAKIADQLRPFLKPGDKVIWRDAFRWKDDNGVLSNHYDGMDLPQLAADFGYDVLWDTNMHHAAIVRAALTTTSGDSHG